MSAGDLKNWFNGLPVQALDDGGDLKYWFNGLPLPSIQAAATQTLTPGLFSDTDTFFAPTLTAGATLTPGLFSDTDTFFAPTVAPGAVTLTPSLFSDTDTFYQPTVVFDQSLAASLYTDSDTFFAPTVDSHTTLTPSLFSDADTFYQPAVAAGAVTLTPSLFTDTDSFYAPSVDVFGALAPSLFSDTDTFFQPTVAAGAATLTPALFTDTDTFYVPGEAATSTLTPSLFSDTDTFYSPSLIGRGAVLPGLVDESTVVYPAAVSSRYSLAAPLVTDADSIPRPAVTNGYPLNPALYSDADSFFRPTLVPGLVHVLPSRYIDADVFYTAAVQLQSTQGGGGGGSNSIPANVKYATQFTMSASGLITALQVQANSANSTVQTRMMLYADSSGLPGALLAQSNAKTGVAIGTNTYPLVTPYAVLAGQKVWVTIHTNNTLAVLGNTKSGARYNTDTFSDGPTDPFGPSSLDNKKAPVLLVLLSSANASVLPTLFSDTDTFYSPALSERNTLVPPLHSDQDFFYAPRLGLNLQPGIVADSDTFYSPAVAPGAVTLQPTLMSSDDVVSSPNVAAFSPTIFPPHLDADDNFVLGDGVNVTPQGTHALPGAYADSDAFYVPTVLDTYSVTAPGLNFGDAIFVPVVSRGSVTLRPGLVAANDQFWLEAVVQGVGTRKVQPGLVAADDVFYPPNRGAGPLVRRTATIKGSTKLSTKTLSARSANGVNLIGDDSKVKIDLEGNDA